MAKQNEFLVPAQMQPIYDALIVANHPPSRMISVNGLMVDARRMPREIQEEAFRRGLIPYLPE